MFASVSCFALISVVVGFNFYITSLRLAAVQKWGPNRLVDTLKVAKMQKRYSWLALPEIRRNTSLSLAEAVISMGKPVNVLEGHTGKVTAISFHPTENQIVTSSHDKTVKLWNVSGKEIATMNGHSDEVSTVSFNNKGEIIASGSKDKTVRLWTVDGKVYQVLRGHKSPVKALDFSENDQFLVSADKEGDIQISKISSDARYYVTKEFTAHPTAISSLDINPKQKLLASVDFNGNVKIWDFDGQLINSIALERFPKEEIDEKRSRIKVEFSQTGNEISILGSIQSANGMLSDKSHWVYEVNGELISSSEGYSSRAFSKDILQFKASAPPDSKF